MKLTIYVRTQWKDEKGKLYISKFHDGIHSNFHHHLNTFTINNTAPSFLPSQQPVHISESKA
jgi:hypothetical protein